MNVEILPHPPEVIKVDPQIIIDMIRRLAAPRGPIEPVSIFDRD
jgi:hypothetical protein